MGIYRNNADPVSEKPVVLATWKGIAAYFGCNVRTVRRYEQERGLPVHRAPGKKGGTVFAYASELDAWLESSGKGHGSDPDWFTSDTPCHVGDVPRGNGDSTHATPPSTASSFENRAKHASFPGWRPWVFATTALLIPCALLFWKFGNHQKAAAAFPAELVAFKPHVPAPGAQDLFLHGRYYWNLRTADGLARAIDSYTQAIVADPSYAEAYAGLAEAYDLLPQFGHADLGDSLTKAEKAADRAIDLDPNLASAHRAKAFALFFWDWDIADSDSEFRKAIALDPNSAQTHQWYASTLHSRLEGAHCLKEINKAEQLDPTSPSIAADAAYYLAEFGDFGAGVTALKELERTQPTLTSPSLFLRQIDFATGDYQGYIAEARRYASITGNPDDTALANEVAEGWTQSGKIGLLEGRARALKSAFDHGNEPGFKLGETLLLLGRREEALVYFRASLKEHCLPLTTMQLSPWAKPLLGDPGYAALFDQVRKLQKGQYPFQPSLARASLELPQ
jgi:tetratricopeptide (TPR) repeat protein